MDKTWLIIDIPFLCYRAFYTTGHLSEEGEPTGVLFGVLRDISTFHDKFRPSRTLLCFDYGIGSRLEINPFYKQSRRRRYEQCTPEETKARDGLHEQVNILRTKLLRQCGFRNVLFQLNREADDIIAAACEKIPQHIRLVIISSDQDLYQVLDRRTVIYNPTTKQKIDLTTFQNKWAISPSQWADVKALAGCKTDDIPGIQGVGEKTAAKFLRGRLKSGSVIHTRIVKGNAIWRENLRLVALPFPGTVIRPLRPDRVTGHRWSKACCKYKLGSLRRQAPGGGRG